MNGLGRGDKREKEDKQSVFTRETVGITLLLFSALALLICVTRSLMFGDVGVAITAFLLGVFGYAVYPILALLIVFSIQLFIGKRLLPKKWTLWGILIFVGVFFIVHLATSTRFLGSGIGSYLGACYTAGVGGVPTSTAGGVLFGLIVYPLQFILSVTGAYVVLAFALLVALFFAVRSFQKGGRTFKKQKKAVEPTLSADASAEGAKAYPGSFDDLPPARVNAPLWEERANAEQPVAAAQPAPAGESDYVPSNRDILFGASPASIYRDNLIFDRDSRFNTQPRSSSVEQVSPSPIKPSYTASAQSYQERYSKEVEQTRPAMPRRVETQEPASFRTSGELNYSQTPSYRASSAPVEEKVDYYRHDVAPREVDLEEESEEFTSAPNVFDEPEVSPVVERSAIVERPAVAEEKKESTPPARSTSDFRNLFSSSNERLRGVGEVQPAREELARKSEPQATSRLSETPSRALDGLLATERGSAADLFEDAEPIEVFDEPAPVRERVTRERTVQAPATAIPAGQAPAPERHVYKPYVRPRTDLFQVYPEVSISADERERNSSIIVDTLAGFRVEAEVVRVTTGSAVTRYDIDIPGHIAVSTVLKRDEEIAMRLHARDGVNMYANPEYGAISIEVPNSVRATVGVRSVMESEAFQNTKPTSLVFAIGKDVEGRPVCGDIVKMKHLLVAGATGSGKSVCLNAMLVSLISKYSPEDLRLILIDPKKVEFAIYNGIPHLMINEIISDAQKAVTALNWAIKEMERRYQLFESKTLAGMNVQNIDGYNACLTDGEEKLAKIVVVVDELADLMSVAKKDIEDRIQRLTQKARAAGIHLVLATQRPSVDVITGVIKGNLPTRIAFRVIQEVDSRTILDESGAQKLLGLGDMLYRTEGMFAPLRVQCAFLSSEEVQKAVMEIKERNESYFDESVAQYINNVNASSEGSGAMAGDGDDGKVDPVYIRALAMVVKLGSVSISFIQRKCSVGYNHAGKIVEWMEQKGYIPPFDGKAKARPVLMTKDEFISKYGDAYGDLD